MYGKIIEHFEGEGECMTHSFIIPLVHLKSLVIPLFHLKKKNKNKNRKWQKNPSSFFLHRGNRHFTIPQKGMGEWRVENGRTTDSKDKISVTLVFSFGFFLKVRSQFISIIICFSLIFVVKSLEKKENLKKD